MGTRRGFKVEMDRAFSPRNCDCIGTQGVALDWDGGAPLALRRGYKEL